VLPGSACLEADESIMPRPDFNQVQSRSGCLVCLVAGFLLLTSASINVEGAQRPGDLIQVNPLPRAPSIPFAVNGASPASNPRAAEIAIRLRNRLTAVRGSRASAARPPSPSSTRKERRQNLNAQIRQRADGSVKVWMHPHAGTPRQIKGRRLQRASRTGVSEAERAKRTARRFLRANRDLLRIEDPDRDVVLRHMHRDHLGRRHLRYALSYRGLPAWPAELIVHLDPDGNADLMSGGYPRFPRRLTVDPVVAENAAIESAVAAVPSGTQAEVSGPELIVYAPVTRRPRLAWKMEVHVSLESRWLVIVDALNGAVLESYNLVTDVNVAGSGTDLFGLTRLLNVWGDGGTFYMVDASKQMFDPTSNPASPDTNNIRGAIVIKDAANQPPTSNPTSDPVLLQVTSNNANSGWLADAVSASFGLSETYDYYLERHNRDSLDGQGGTMTAVVRFGQNIQNAFWIPSLRLMVFGDGLPFARALDVVGHEFTHGVTTNSADLVSRNQSGALNEAFSDIFGEMVEARTKGTPDWLKGGPDLGITLQNYASPSTINCIPNTPCPSKMSEFINTTLDNGGVHINSSIINHAFYLLAQGLQGAIGLQDAERIFYRTLTTKLVRQSQFIDARLGAVASAEELFGVGSAQAQKTAEAFDAVEILDAPPTPGPSPVPGVSGRDATLFVFFDPNFGTFLGRREEALGDGPLGVFLSNFGVQQTRASVSGDGSLAAFVDSVNDFCLILTDASSVESCLNLPGTVFSVAMSPDANRFALVLLDQFGQADNSILLVDVAANTNQTIPLRAPLIDGGTINVVKADAIDFSSDGQLIVYDAFNNIRFDDGSSIGLWSVYAVDLTKNLTFVLVPPTVGFDIGFPAFSQTSDEILTFDAVDAATGTGNVFAGSLITGATSLVASVPNAGFTAPVYTGDDAAIVYHVPDLGTSTGRSLVRQPVGADRITPSGSVQSWVTDAEFGVIYRRGSFTAPQPFSLSVTKSGEGLVISTPEGIVCGADCSENYLDGSTVNLVANGDVGWAFTGWNGGVCSGTGVCTVTLAANTMVTAIFAVIDSDNDGLPDVFESANGLDPFDSSDAGADHDGDTFTTLDEFLAGSNPFDPGSTLLSTGDAFVQDDLTGFWHSYAYFDNATGGNDPGWDICSPDFDPAGIIVIGGCIDADDVPAVLDGSATLVDNGAFVPAGEWVQGVDTAYYQLDVGKTVLAGVVTSSGGDEFPTLDLMAGEGSGYRQDDLTGTWHRYRYSDSEGFTSDPHWTDGRVVFDATGLIIDSKVVRSDAPFTPLAPWVGSATLAPDGEVLPAGDWVSTETAFSLSMDAGKSVVVGVATRNESGALFQDQQLWVKQGSAYTQSDLEGTWYLYAFTDTSSGTQMPRWTRRTLLVDAAGAVVAGSGVDSEGMLLPQGGTLTIAADGRVTLSGGLAASLLFQELRLDAGRTVIGGVLSVDVVGEPFERLVVAVKSGSARPEILSPVPGSVLPGASATWQWTDNGILVTDWQLAIGTSPGGTDIHDSGVLPAVSREHTVSGLPTAGQTVFVRLLFREAGVWLFSEVQYTAFTTPAPPPPPPQAVSSSPDLSTWGLIAMVLGIWIMVRIDARRRATRR